MNFFKQLKKISLSKEEKEKSWDFLLARTGLVRNYNNNRHNIQKVTFLPLLLNHKYMLAGFLIAVILAMGGGTAAAAENAVPGDLLYPVKLAVNEEVRAALATTAEAKATWDARRAERRLEEVEKLAGKGKLTTSTSQFLSGKFEEFAVKAEKRLEKLQASGKLSEEQVQKLKSNFEVAVSAHDEVLSRLQEREGEKDKLKDMLESLREKASSTMRNRIEHEWEFLKVNTSSTLKTVAENRKNAAQNKIAEVEKFITNNTDKVSVENSNEANKKLAEAKNIVLEGDKAYAEAKYGEAIIKYSEAHRKAQEAQLYMTKRFRLERRQEVTSSTPAVFATGSLQFNNEKRQEVWDTHESLKNLEQRLREEVKQTREGFQELRKQESERIREEIKNKKEEIKEDNEEEKNEDSAIFAN